MACSLMGHVVQNMAPNCDCGAISANYHCTCVTHLVNGLCPNCGLLKGKILPMSLPEQEKTT